MLRIIVKDSMADYNGVHVGDKFKTFDLHHPAIEHYLSEKDSYRVIIGCEVIQPKERA